MIGPDARRHAAVRAPRASRDQRRASTVSRAVGYPLGVRFLRDHWIHVAVPLAVVAAIVLALLLFGGDPASSGGYEI